MLGLELLLFGTFCTGPNVSKELRLWLLESPCPSLPRLDCEEREQPWGGRCLRSPNLLSLGSDKILSKRALQPGNTCLGTSKLAFWEDYTFQGTVVSQILGMMKNKNTTTEQIQEENVTWTNI